MSTVQLNALLAHRGVRLATVSICLVDEIHPRAVPGVIVNGTVILQIKFSRKSKQHGGNSDNAVNMDLAYLQLSEIVYQVLKFRADVIDQVGNRGHIRCQQYFSSIRAAQADRRPSLLAYAITKLMQ